MGQLVSLGKGEWFLKCQETKVSVWIVVFQSILAKCVQNIQERITNNVHVSTTFIHIVFQNESEFALPLR